MAEKNKCKDCGGEVGNRSPRCAECEEKHKNKQRLRWDARIKAGLCPRCGDGPALPNQKACFKCSFNMEEKDVEDWVSLAYGKSELAPSPRKPSLRSVYKKWAKNK
jgi:hypothetical protein